MSSKQVFTVIATILILLQIGFVANVPFADTSKNSVLTLNTVTDNLKELPQFTRTNTEGNLFDVIVLINEVNTFSTKSVDLRIIANNTSNEVAYVSIIQEPRVEIVFGGQVILETIHVSKKNFVVAPKNVFVIAKLSINIPGPCIIRVHRGSYVAFINGLKLLIEDMIVETTINYTRTKAYTTMTTENTKNISSKKTPVIVSDIVVDGHVLGPRYEEHELNITYRTESSTTPSTIIQTTMRNNATSTYIPIGRNRSASASVGLDEDSEYIKIPLEIIYALILTIAVLIASKLIVYKVVR